MMKALVNTARRVAMNAAGGRRRPLGYWLFSESSAEDACNPAAGENVAPADESGKLSGTIGRLRSAVPKRLRYYSGDTRFIDYE